MLELYNKAVNKTYFSPNFDQRPCGKSIDLIILHYTDMPTHEAALERLCDATSKVSAHFLIAKNGSLYQLVNTRNRAWHAGVASWQGQGDINSRSIGIELDNAGHVGGLEPFPSRQINALVDLLQDLTGIYGISPHGIIGHSDVAPLRKQDPGELFPWKTLSRRGFGIWPKKLSCSATQFQDIEAVQKAFHKIGYDCPQTNVWDECTRHVCLAFQRHFLPSELTGKFSQKTGYILGSVLQEIHPTQN